jgi:uncharacterized Zn finger protein
MVRKGNDSKVSAEDNPPCEECGGKTHKSSKVMTREGKKQKYHCIECGHYQTENSHKRYTYNFEDHPYTIVVVE